MRSLLPALVSNLVFLAILLVSAGSPSYWPAWVYLGTGVLAAILTRLVLRQDPELAKERAKPGPGATTPCTASLFLRAFVSTCRTARPRTSSRSSAPCWAR
jgi:hypothetical protein